MDTAISYTFMQTCQSCHDEEYINFCELHKMTFNVPYFGDDFNTQAIFMSLQINCSTGITHVREITGGIHSNLQDCSASYLMSINMSVMRDIFDFLILI